MKTKEPKPLHNHRLGSQLTMTPIKECIERRDHNLVLYSLPIGTKIKGTAVSTSNSGRIFFLSEQGYLYDLRKGNGISIIEKTELARVLTQNELRALRRLGLFTGKQISDAVKAEKEREKRRNAARKADRLMECAKSCGIPAKEVTKLLRKAA